MPSNKPIFLIAFLCSGLTAMSQNGNEVFFAFREDGSPAGSLNRAAYFMHRVKENDTTYVCRFYQTTGPMIKCETYKDENLSIPHGRFAWYNKTGSLDSTGLVKNVKKDGYWEFRKPDGSMNMSVFFENGKHVWTRNFTTNITTYADGRMLDLNSKSYKDSIAAIVDAIADKKPAEFKGGLKGWSNYIEKTLQTPGRFSGIAGRGARGRVVVSFTIDTEGRATDMYIDHSVEWSVDMETIRILKESPRWSPAMQNGKPVIYRHKQSVTFVVS